MLTQDPRDVVDKGLPPRPKNVFAAIEDGVANPHQATEDQEDAVLARLDEGGPVAG